MERLTTPAGITLTYDKSGGGPPLVLVHGAFSDHHTNWEFVKPILQERFTLYAIARRGRGGTDATVGHGLEDEVADVVAVIEAVREPVYLLGHSHARIGILQGQAHEGMTTAPEMYASAVSAFLLGAEEPLEVASSASAAAG